MAPKFLLRQEDFIYDLEWMQRADKLFIEVLVDQHAIGNFKIDGPNVHALLIAQDVVNNELNKAFTYEYMRERLNVLKKRHDVFFWVKRKHGVKYDSITNRMSAPDFIWEEIAQENEFGIAYHEFGDPDWTDLQRLFAKDNHSIVENGPEIITISSDHESDDIGKKDVVPKPSLGDSIINISSSWSSLDLSFWNYLEQFGPSSGSDSESSVNQPIHPMGRPPYPGPSFYRSPNRAAPRPPRPYLPSPSKSAGSSSSSCQPH